ncbi:hypothetical protein LMTR13_09980 [Bradyrhizobium icense]|uniref:Uncharacterized protein n=1 Tax=Bradyrhizobium icense TaxID=1274631 RepID=A0A1B1UCG1_9BRAD|nr:hypothetical protein LMTR13_09980 [Bradyrhizobium icense]
MPAHRSLQMPVSSLEGLPVFAEFSAADSPLLHSCRCEGKSAKPKMRSYPQPPLYAINRVQEPFA